MAVAAHVQALKARVARRERERRRAETLTIAAGRAGLVAVLLVLWETLSGRVLDPFFVSSPSAILRALRDLAAKENLLGHTQYTVVEVLAGYAAGAAAAILLAFLVTSFGRLYDILEPLLVAMYGIPRTALAPLFIMWFGLGITSKIIIAALFVFFVVFMNTVSGIHSTSPQLASLTRLMGGGSLDILVKIVLPSALPFVLTALRIAVPSAMIGAIIGEFISAQKGLGFLINRSTFEFSTSAAFAGIFVLLLVVVAMNAVVNRAERALLRWRPTGGGSVGEGG